MKKIIQNPEPLYLEELLQRLKDAGIDAEIKKVFLTSKKEIRLKHYGIDFSVTPYPGFKFYDVVSRLPMVINVVVYSLFFFIFFFLGFISIGLVVGFFYGGILVQDYFKSDETNKAADELVALIKGSGNGTLNLSRHLI